MFDIIVIGGGPGGYMAAERAGHAGLNVLLIEKRALGGVCLNEGCIPSKTLLNSAKIYDYALHGEAYGVTASAVSLDHRAVVARKNRVVNTLVGGVKSLMKANKVTVLYGEAYIIDNSHVKVNDEVYEGSRLIIAAGSAPIVPPIEGVAEGINSGFVLTSREILDLEDIPEKLTVIGGGVIGLEMASYYSSAGSKVTIVEMLDRVGGTIDREIAGILQKSYAKKGIEFILGARVTAVTDSSVVYELADGQKGSVSMNAGGRKAAVSMNDGDSKNGPAPGAPANGSPVCDKVLLSIGRRPVTSGFGLENTGVLLERGAIITDSNCLTNIPNIYAVGDVNGKYMLAHAAYREAEVAVNHILGKRDIMRYCAIPSVVYTSPEVACVGETEETAAAKGLEFDSVALPMIYSGRYIAENAVTDGICKVLVGKARRNVIGVHMIGGCASEIILSACVMIEMQMRVDDVKEIVFPHPTVGEMIRESVFRIT